MRRHGVFENSHCGECSGYPVHVPHGMRILHYPDDATGAIGYGRAGLLDRSYSSHQPPVSHLSSDGALTYAIDPSDPKDHLWRPAAYASKQARWCFKSRRAVRSTGLTEIQGWTFMFGAKKYFWGKRRMDRAFQLAAWRSSGRPRRLLRREADANGHKELPTEAEW